MSQIWVSSDTHFCHNQPFLYEPRGFSNIYEHDEKVILNWNTTVDPDDTAYLLGDIMLNDDERGLKCLSRLNGNIHLILGNHDSARRIEAYDKVPNIVSIQYSTVIKHNNQVIYLSHYPALCGNYDDDKPLKAKVINLCGHSHTKDKFQDMDKGIIYHCELDAHNCYPVLLDNAIEDIRRFLK